MHQLERGNADRIAASVRGLRRWLKAEHEGRVFRTNRHWVFVGAVLSVVVALLTAQPGPMPTEGLFMMAWLCFWSAGVVWLVTSALTAWRFVRAGAGRPALARAIRLSLFALPFLAGEVVGLVGFAATGGLAGAFVLVVLAFVNALFVALLRAPTVAGRRLVERLAGFRMYLAATQDGLGRAIPGPALTRELFDRYLPYAMAFDLEVPWACRFEAALAAAGDASVGAALPSWYSGQALATTGRVGFGPALAASLASTICASATGADVRSDDGAGGSSGGGDGGGW